MVVLSGKLAVADERERERERKRERDAYFTFWRTREDNVLLGVSDENGEIGRNEMRNRVSRACRLKRVTSEPRQTLSKTLIQNHSRTQQTANHWWLLLLHCGFPGVIERLTSEPGEQRCERESCSASRCENKVAESCPSVFQWYIHKCPEHPRGYREASCFTDRSNIQDQCFD